MPISITNIITALENKIAALDSSVSSQDMRHFYNAADFADITITQTYDSAGLLPTADSDYKGQIALTMPSADFESGNALYICVESDGGMAWNAFQTLDSASNLGILQKAENYGYIAGGFNLSPWPTPRSTTSGQNNVERFSFASSANSVDIGDIPGSNPYERSNVISNSSLTHFYRSGGTHFPPGSNNIMVTDATSTKQQDKFPFASTSNHSALSALSISVGNGAGDLSSPSHAYTAGGMATFPPGVFSSTQITKFSFANDGSDQSDVGDLTAAASAQTGASTKTHGYVVDGSNPSTGIEKFPFTSDTNATDIGDLVTINPNQRASGSSGPTHGYKHGSPYDPANPGVFAAIDKFSFSSDGNATSVGRLTRGLGTGAGGHSGGTHGYASGGNADNTFEPNFGASSQNRIDRYSFSSDGDATDVGDLLVPLQDHGFGSN